MTEAAITSSTSSTTCSTDTLNKLKEQLKCPVCLGILVTPKLLHCNHAFCEVCIDSLPVQLHQEGYSVRCPTCRKPTKLPQDDAANLPPAFHLNTLIELLDATKNELPLLLRLHTIDSTATLTKRDGRKKCQEHNRPLEMYCNDCQQVVCVECSHDHHHHHDCHFVAKIFPQHKQEIDDSLKSVTQKTRAVMDALSHLDAQENDAIQNGESVKKDINTLLEKLVATMKRTAEQLKQSVDTIVREKLSKIAKQKEIGKAILHKLETIASETQCLLERESQEEILLEKGKVIEQVRAVSQRLTLQQLQLEETADIVFRHRRNIFEKCSKIGEVGMSTATTKLCSTRIAVAGRQRSIDITMPNVAWLDRITLSCHLVSEDGGMLLQCRTKHIEKERYRITFTPTQPGLHHVKTQVRGSDIHCDPCTIQVIPSLERVGHFTGIHRPETITLAPDDKLIVTEYSNSTTSIISSTGDVIRRYKYKGGVVRTGVCLSRDDCIIVLTRHTPHITKYRRDYTLVGTASSSHGDGPLQFKWPGGVATNTKDMIFVCDSGNNRIQALNADLTFSHMFGERGKGMCQFNNPTAIAIDSQDVLYICDSGNRSIKRFMANGQCINEFSLPIHPLYIALDGDILYVTTTENVLILDKEGQVIEVLDLPDCHGVAARDGNIFLCDHTHNAIIALKLPLNNNLF